MEIYTSFKQTNKHPVFSRGKCRWTAPISHLPCACCLLAKRGTLEQSVWVGNVHFANAGSTFCGAQGWLQAVIKFFLPISTEVLSVYRRDVYMFLEHLFRVRELILYSKQCILIAEITFSSFLDSRSR